MYAFGTENTSESDPRCFEVILKYLSYTSKSSKFLYFVDNFYFRFKGNPNHLPKVVSHISKSWKTSDTHVNCLRFSESGDRFETLWAAFLNTVYFR